MSRLHTVDPTTITETKDFRIIARMDNGYPSTVVRLSDNKTVCIGDLVTNGTKMKGKVEGFHLTVSETNGELIMWIDHDWSKVGMALADIKDAIWLPSRYQVGHECSIGFGAIAIPVATVMAVHFYEGKVKYDLEIKIAMNTYTRIYNVDSGICEDPIRKKKQEPA